MLKLSHFAEMFFCLQSIILNFEIQDASLIIYHPITSKEVIRGVLGRGRMGKGREIENLLCLKLFPCCWLCL